MTSGNEVLTARPYIAGQWVDGEMRTSFVDKFTGEHIADVHQPSRAQLDAGLAALAEAQSASRWQPYDRFLALAGASESLVARREEAARLVVQDSGFTITDARREVDRAVQTLLLSAEEAKRIVGEMVPLQAAPGGTQRLAFTIMRPVGVVCAITPFNSPLNTLLHKVAPALAAGNAVVIKPASLTPLTAAWMVSLLLETGVPPGMISVVFGGGADVGQWLLESSVPDFYAFTGSTAVGEHVRRTVGLRRTQLEMGSLSSTIVCEDADLASCLPLCVNAAFRKAGQVCTSVQRLYVHEGIRRDVLDGLAEVLRNKEVGDPTKEEVFVGPLVSRAEAERVTSWIERAVEGGAEVVCGGGTRGSVVEPTVLTGVRADMDVMCHEVFGPVVVIREFTDLDEAIAEVNDTAFGLAAGIFTNKLSNALVAARDLRMGSVHINETSSSRVDVMPYTGVKASGLGREGPHWAVREMSEERLITIGPCGGG